MKISPNLLTWTLQVMVFAGYSAVYPIGLIESDSLAINLVSAT